MRHRRRPDLPSGRVHDYRYFDCDNHCYEPRDAFTRHLPKEYLDRAITTVRTADDNEMILAGGRIAKFTSEAGLCFETADRPGSLHEMLREMATGNPSPNYRQDPMQPEFVERDARLRFLDSQNVERCVIYPGIARPVRGGVHRRHRRALRQPVVVQPVVRRRLGLQLPGPPLRAGGPLVARPRSRGRAHRRSARERRADGDAPDRSRGWTRSRTSVLRPGVGAPERSGRGGDVPHHAALVLQDHVPRMGRRSRPGLMAHVGVAVDERLRRTADHRHHLVGDLRQPLRSLPATQRSDRRTWCELAPAHAQADGQEPGHGPERTLAGRPARGTTVEDLPAARPRRPRIRRTTSCR